MSQISISEAARRWKISRTTIQRKVKSGDVSVSQIKSGVKNNSKLIDISELIRVFGEPLIQLDARTEHEPQVILTQGDDAAFIEHLKAENKRLTKELEKAHNHIMDGDKKLLEHQTKPLWKKLLLR